MATQGFIKYKGDYKYQLAEGYEIHVSIKPNAAIKTDFIELEVDGKLTVKKGYAWDGPSGPVKDTRENMRGSLVHDALYQLMRMEKLNSRKHREAADREFKEICKADGVSGLRASLYYKALRKFGKPAASVEKKKKVYRAPED